MSLRIGQKQFFLNKYRTRNFDTLTNREQADCERAVEILFHDFFKQKSSSELK